MTSSCRNQVLSLDQCDGVYELTQHLEDIYLRYLKTFHQILRHLLHHKKVLDVL